MKKIVAIVLCVIALCFMLTGCNENWGFGNYEYRHARINDGEKGYCAEVNSWHDNEIGIELHTKEFGDIYCAEGSYLLFEDGSKCPFC